VVITQILSEDKLVVMDGKLPNNAFVRLLNLMRAISVLPAGVTLDPQEERLMQELGLRWGHGEAVTVLAAMNMLTGASPSTVQRRLKTLREKGLLNLVASPDDARVRHVVASNLGRAYFTRMSGLMREAVGRNSRAG
jgi:DNA-binding MarR family transcriptional regulator